MDKRDLEVIFDKFNDTTMDLERSYTNLEMTLLDVASQSGSFHTEISENEEQTANQFWEFRKSIIFLLETINSPVFIIDSDFNVQYFNKNVMTVFGTEEKQGTFDNIFSEQGKKAVEKFLDSENESLVIHLNVIHPFSGIIPFSATKHFDPLSKSPLISLVCLENSLLNRKTDKHQEFLQNMAENVAHNLRTPMTAVVGYANLISRDLMNQTNVSSKLGTLIEGIQRIDFIIRNLIDYSHNQQNSVSEEYDLIELCRIIANGFVDENADNPMQLKVNVNSGLSILKTIIDKHTIKTVLNNFLLNSMESAVNDSVDVDIYVRIKNREDLIEILVTDNGKGMNEEEIEKCKEPFYTTKLNSLGLGLSIAENLLAEIGGDFKVSALETGGTRIKTFLPNNSLAIQNQKDKND